MSKSSKSPPKATNQSSKHRPIKRIDKRSAVDGELIADAPEPASKTATKTDTAASQGSSGGTADSAGQSNKIATAAKNAENESGAKISSDVKASSASTKSKPLPSAKDEPKPSNEPEPKTPKVSAAEPAATTQTQTQATSKPNNQTMTQTNGSTSKSTGNASSTQTVATNTESKLPLVATILGALALAVGIYNWYQSNVVGFQTMGSQQSKLVSLDEKVGNISSSQQAINQAFEQNKSLLSQEFETSKAALTQQIEQNKNTLTQQLTQTREVLDKQISDNQLVLAGQLDEVKNRVADVQQGIGTQLLDTKSTLNSQVSTLEQKVLSGRGKLDLLINEAGHALDDKVQTAGKQAREQAEKFRTEYSSLASALGAMNRDFSASKQSLAMSEVGNLLSLADQRLRLGGDIAVASEALKLADQQLEKQQSDDFIELRKAINDDVNTLAAAPAVDVSGIVLRLSALSGAVAEWPLQADKEEAAPAAAGESAPASDEGGGFLSLGKQLMSQMVEVRSADAEKKPSLAPQERYFLSENFRLKLQAAQLGVLKEQQDAFSENIKSAQEWVQTHFDAQDASVADAIQQLGDMAGTQVTAERPTIIASLDAFAALKSSQ